MNPSGNHWEQHALDWHYFAPPLRPCAEDIEWMECAVFQKQPSANCALLLGVTPEIARMRWPQNIWLLAIDHCFPMIIHVWPKSGTPRDSQALVGEWTSFPLSRHSIDIVCGDGVVLFFSYPEGVRQLGREIKRILRLDGLFLLRAFIRPEKSESLEQLHTDLTAGRIGSFHVYKWRLNMALQNNLQEGVNPLHAWDAWRSWVPDPNKLAQRTGWPIEEINTIQAYQHSNAIYRYPLLEELLDALADDFQLLDVTLPGYELGDRCPLLKLQPRY